MSCVVVPKGRMLTDVAVGGPTGCLIGFVEGKRDSGSRCGIATREERESDKGGLAWILGVHGPNRTPPLAGETFDVVTADYPSLIDRNRAGVPTIVRKEIHDLRTT